MSEENKMIYCTECGSENAGNSKFCCNCGIKLEKNESTMQPVYEKIEAEILEENTSESIPVPEVETVEPIQEAVVESNEIPTQQEIDIQYDAEDNTSSAPVYRSPEPQYYSAAQSTVVENTNNGYVGVSIASMICGILSLLCCCFTFFSLILGVAAIVLGIISVKNDYEGKGMAIAGMVTGGIGAFIAVIIIIIGGFGGLFTDGLDEIMNY